MSFLLLSSRLCCSCCFAIAECFSFPFSLPVCFVFGGVDGQFCRADLSHALFSVLVLLNHNIFSYLEQEIACAFLLPRGSRWKFFSTQFSFVATILLISSIQLLPMFFKRFKPCNHVVWSNPWPLLSLRNIFRSVVSWSRSSTSIHFFHCKESIVTAVLVHSRSVILWRWPRSPTKMGTLREQCCPTTCFETDNNFWRLRPTGGVFVCVVLRICA